MESFYIELFDGNPRFGPGSNESTQKAYSFIKDLPSKPIILDIGCGSGMQTIELAKISKGKIYAIDIFQEYLDALKENAEKEEILDQIEIIKMSMDDMDFKPEFFDIIWAEGSIFIIGFENGLIQWKKFLKNNGYLVVSELIWFKDDPPEELREFFNAEYPPMKNNEENIKICEKSGYKVVNSFNSPETDWWEHFYTPLEKRLKILREKHENDSNFLQFLGSMQEEIGYYRKYSDYYGYAFYILQNY